MKRKYLALIFIIAILLLSTIAAAGFWQDVTGMFSLSNLFKKTATELPKVQTAKAYSLMLSKTELNKEKKFVAQIGDIATKNRLNRLLNYKPKEGEKLDARGNLIAKLPSGKEVVISGYQEQKAMYEMRQKYKEPEWKELAEIKSKIKNEKPVLTAKTPAPAIKLQRPALKPIGIDPLNRINPLFHQTDFSPQGFMYHAADLYRAGVFPFFLYLTPAKDQAERGTCDQFATVGAIELLSLNRPDLSEQNLRYQYLGVLRDPMYDGVAIGLESEWPYNPEECSSEGHYLSENFKEYHPEYAHDMWIPPEQYYTNVLHGYIPCSVSEVDHQGISVEDHYEAHSAVRSSSAGRCVIDQDLFYPSETSPDITSSRAVEYIADVIDVGYPVQIGINWHYGLGEMDEAGLFSEIIDVPSPDWGHAVLIVGFIPKESVPDAVKTSPYFISNEDYFIIKNSWGKDWGDNGFFYVPRSKLLGHFHYALSYRYDLTS